MLSAKFAQVAIFVFLINISTLNITTKFANAEENKPTTKKDIQNYFSIKRKQHLEAIDTLRKLQRYEQKYDMVRKIFEKIFETLKRSRIEIEKSDYVLGEELPKNELVEHILYILDNCAFFGNLALKFPDITNRILNENNQGNETYKWCFAFSVSSNLLDEKSLKMFNLASQQLNIVPKSEDFINPYEKKVDKKQKKNENESKKRKSKPKISKGPRLSRTEL